MLMGSEDLEDFVLDDAMKGLGTTIAIASLLAATMAQVRLNPPPFMPLERFCALMKQKTPSYEDDFLEALYSIAKEQYEHIAKMAKALETMEECKCPPNPSPL